VKKVMNRKHEGVYLDEGERYFSIARRVGVKGVCGKRPEHKRVYVEKGVAETIGRPSNVRQG